MPRELNNPDMPTMAYKYDIRIIGELPQEAWDAGKAMNALYSELAERHEAFCGAFKTADEETRKRQFSALMRNGKGGVLYERAKASKDALNFRYYWNTWERFRKAQKRFAKGAGGAPKPKRVLERMLLPAEFGNLSEPVEWIHADPNARVHIRASQGPTRGHFVIHTPSNEVVVPFEIVMDRPLPERALIKGVALSGFHERPFEWKWSLIFSLQVPPHPKAPPVNRAAGLDLGWRDMGDYIRIGLLADTAGDLREFRLHYDLTRNKDRKFIERKIARGETECPMPRDVRLIRDMQRKMDERLEACKIDLAGVDRSAWPDEAKKVMAGIVKMRAGGLRRIRRELFTAGISYEFLEDWHFWWETNLRRYRAAQIKWIARRDEIYRLIADWIARNYDAVAWEKLSLKDMAEQGGRRKSARKKEHEQTGEWDERTVDDRILEASMKRRQWASLHTLRGYIKEAMTKRGRDLQDRAAAYSSQICDECGQRIEPGHELARECAERHVEDQDISAALYYLRLIQDTDDKQAPEMRAVTGISAPVDRSQLLRVVAPISPMNAG